MPKQYIITARAILTVPPGTVIAGRDITLPDGNVLKPWVTLELNEGDDLTFDELEALRVELDPDDISIEESTDA